MILWIVIGGFVLLTAAGSGGRLGNTFHPSHRARLLIGMLLTGWFLVMTGLVLWAAPVVLDMVGLVQLASVCLHIVGGVVPGGEVGGMMAGLASGLMLGGSGRACWSVLRAQHDMRIETLLSPHEVHDGFELFVLPSSQQLAFTVGGRRPQVVLTTAVVESLDPELVEAIAAHEGVHARRGHHRFLAAAAAVGATLGWYRPVTAAVGSVRLFLERWADEDASTSARTGRDDVRRALLGVCMADATPGMAGFGGAETVTARVSALGEPPPAKFSGWAAAAYACFGVVVVFAVVAAGWAAQMSVLALLHPGQCLM